MFEFLTPSPPLQVADAAKNKAKSMEFFIRKPVLKC